MYNYFILSYFLKRIYLPKYVPNCFSMQTQFIGKKDWRKAPPPGIYFGALRGFLVSWLEDKVSQKCGGLACMVIKLLCLQSAYNYVITRRHVLHCVICIYLCSYYKKSLQI